MKGKKEQQKNRLGTPNEGSLAYYRRIHRENGPEYAAWAAQPVTELPRPSLRAALKSRV